MTRKEILSRALESLEFVIGDLEYLLRLEGYEDGAFLPDNDLGYAASDLDDAKTAIKRLIENDQR